MKCLFVAAESSRSAPELAEAAKNLLTRGLPHQSPTTSRYRPVADWRSHVEELVAGVPRRACRDVMTLTYRTSALRRRIAALPLPPTPHRLVYYPTPPTHPRHSLPASPAAFLLVFGFFVNYCAVEIDGKLFSVEITREFLGSSSPLKLNLLCRARLIFVPCRIRPLYLYPTLQPKLRLVNVIGVNIVVPDSILD